MLCPELFVCLLTDVILGGIIMFKVSERFNALMKKVTENPIMEEDREMLEEMTESFPSYFNAVIMSSLRIKLAKARGMETKELQEEIMSLDRGRRIQHQAMTSSVNVINRLAEAYGVAPVFVLSHDLDGNSKEDRDYAALISFEICVQMYLDETLRKKVVVNPQTLQGLDEVLYKMEQEGITFHTKVKGGE